jgi:crossover junction endodeoxyribonuclease RusA
MELVIGRTPVSAQAANARSKEEWKKTIGEIASRSISEKREWWNTDERPLSATIYYFPPDEMQGDIDNIVKPILDGMTNIVYNDDRYIEKIVVQKFEAGRDWRFRSPSEVLERAVKMEKPALYIRVDDDLSWRDVL